MRSPSLLPYGALHDFFLQLLSDRNVGGQRNRPLSSFSDRYDAACQLAESEYERDGSYHPRYKPEGIDLSKRLAEYRDCHLAFMHNLDIPFDNNASERHLRVAKGKMKQTGRFRSTTHGEAYYCDFLTVVKTASMRDMSVLKTVQAIFAGETNLFAN